MNDIGQSSRDALDTVLQFLPRLVLFLVILAVGYFIAKALEKIIVRVLDRVGFERAVERGGIKRVLANSQYDAGQILARIVFYAVMLFVLSTAFGVFGQNPISTYLSAVIGYLPGCSWRSSSSSSPRPWPPARSCWCRTRSGRCPTPGCWPTRPRR